MKQREIKFRAWDTQRKEMIYGVGIAPTSKVHDFSASTGSDGTTITANREESHYILMQFTGLLDKNGKEIYEGDIVKYPPSNKNYWGQFVGEVSFGGEKIMQCGFVVLGLNSYWSLNSNVEVIGNIYENPELLTP